jgi:hypothetical protein
MSGQSGSKSMSTSSTAPPPASAFAFAFAPPSAPRLAILYPGDRAARDRSDPAESRYAPLFEAFAAAGMAAVPAVYHDDFADEVRQQLVEQQQVQGVLVWHNPIEGTRTRARLDAMLRDVAARGVFVSAHPDTILKLGTKDVLLCVRDLPFGSDVHRVDSLARLKDELPLRLAGGARVLKQQRGHSGIGVWRVEQRNAQTFALRHAQRGSQEEEVDFATVLERLAPYFEQGGTLVDQAWQARMTEGMTRAYLVRDRVAGFGHQAVNALHPAAHDGGPVSAPLPGPRLYSDAQDARFQDLRQRLEGGWIDLLCERTGVTPDALPLLWDADFLPGRRAAGASEESYVLCEINVSSVAPFPESAIAPLVEAVRMALVPR